MNDHSFSAIAKSAALPAKGKDTIACRDEIAPLLPDRTAPLK
ncbi:hypothetical protein [Phormidesmis priestleyi]|nr:hypothetical protein [Phormidesmis priestleyi]